MQGLLRACMRYIIFVLLTALVLAACGTKGPLRLPPADTKADADVKQKGR